MLRQFFLRGLLLCCVVPSLGLAQDRSSFALEVAVGGTGSRWVYNKGSTDPKLENNLGWDLTHHTITLPVDLNGVAAVGRWKLGGGVSYSFIFIRRMHINGPSPREGEAYQISPGTVELGQLYAQAEFDLVRSGIYSMAPKVRLGVFSLDSTHPDRDNFGRKLFWAIGITNQIELGTFSLVLRPERSTALMGLKEQQNRNEEHRIDSIGLYVGLRYWP